MHPTDGSPPGNLLRGGRVLVATDERDRAHRDLEIPSRVCGACGLPRRPGFTGRRRREDPSPLERGRQRVGDGADRHRQQQFRPSNRGRAGRLQQPLRGGPSRRCPSAGSARQPRQPRSQVHDHLPDLAVAPASSPHPELRRHPAGLSVCEGRAGGVREAGPARVQLQDSRRLVRRRRPADPDAPAGEPSARRTATRPGHAPPVPDRERRGGGSRRRSGRSCDGYSPRR